MVLKNIVLFIFSVIVLIEYVLKYHKLLFTILACSIVLFFTFFLIRNITLKGNLDINDIARILKIVTVQVMSLYIYFLTYYKIDGNEFHNRNIYYLLILNLLIIGVFEFNDIYDFDIGYHNPITKIISGISVIVLALLTPKPENFGIHDNVYGFKGNMIWIVVGAILLINFYLGNRKWDDKIKYVTPVLIALIIPLFAHLITNNSWLIYRALCLSLVLTLLEYDTHFFYNSYEDKLKKIYFANEYNFIGISIVSVIILLCARLK